MTKLMDQAIEALKGLPESEQDAMARELLARLEEEEEWDQLVASPKSQAWLEQAAQRAVKSHTEGRTKPFDPSDDQS